MQDTDQGTLNVKDLQSCDDRSRPGPTLRSSDAKIAALKTISRATARFSTTDGSVSFTNYGTVTLGNSLVAGDLNVNIFMPFLLLARGGPPPGQLLIADSANPPRHGAGPVARSRSRPITIIVEGSFL